MKRTILLAAAILPLSLFAQQTFHIKGRAETLRPGTKVYLAYPSGGKNVMDSSTVTGKAFVFKGTVAEPVKGSLFLKPAAGAKRETFTLYIEPVVFTVNLSDSLKHTQITGSSLNADDAELKKAMRPAQEELSKINAEYQKATTEQRRDPQFQRTFSGRHRQASEELLQVQLSFAKAHPNSYISIDALTPLISYEKMLDEAEKTFLALSPQVRNTKAGKVTAENFTAAQNTKIGRPAIAFTQNDVNGKPVSLADFKGKYVLIDFWASWCVPCRKENPHVVAAYEQFKDKGFTVLGISLDKPDAREAWIKAIADDQLTWTQLSDLKFWENEVARAYGVKSIPANFLISPEGKIIAKGLRGDRLLNKLNELLGSSVKGK